MEKDDNLRNDIHPVCPLDGSVMVYQATQLASLDIDHPDVIERFVPSYGCAEKRCSARFRHTQGYFTLEGSPESPTMVPIPRINIAKCPTHQHWLYKRTRTSSEKEIVWCCSIRGCDHLQYNSDIPGSWAAHA